MEESSQSNILLTIGSSFWTLYGRNLQPHDSGFQCQTRKPGIHYRIFPKMVEERTQFTTRKQPGNLNIEKLHIILLFEGDFNNNNKWLGRAVMFNAEVHNLMALEQYGSRRKEKLAAIQCLNKRLLYDYVRCNHIPMALCSNDAKSCYNQIVLIVAALCLCRLGADKALVQSMIGTIHSMQQHVRSIYGDLQIAQG